MNDTELWEAAWWSAVAEPADPCARVLRQALGDREARAWLLGSWSAPPSSLARYPRIDWRTQWNRWRERALSVDIDSELTRVAHAGGGFMTPGDPRWPEHLACLGEEEPMGLWFLGDLPEAPRADRHLSIVGARASTGAGNRSARNMAAFVAAAGVTVVSGGAIGIDIEAHRGALSARGRTICILAGGVCNPYPACHGSDFRAVIDGGGALVSEVAPTARPAKWRFLTRNRLIAAWSGATVVVEAGARSGALATARRAMEYGRELGAVPGAVDAPMSVGCLELARNGATIIRDGRDALELVCPVSADGTEPLFGMPVDEDRGIDALEPTQRRVWEALPRSAPASVEAICVAAALSRDEVSHALMDLSVAGLVSGSTRGWTRTGAGRP
mgnify:FL=1